jgi:cytochrome c553
MNHKLPLIAALFCLQTTVAYADSNEGKSLYSQFRCADCHGTDARKVPAPGVQPLAGMNTDLIYQKTKRFIEARAHDNVITGCGEPPSTIQIKKISDYLATLPK